MTEQQRAAVFAFLERISQSLQDAVMTVLSYSEENKTLAKMWDAIQEFMESDEQPVKTKPLRLRDLPKALPMQHQVMNRKPVLQVARSRC